MANVNKVLFIGRLTRDPEARTFANGGKVVAFGFAVSNRKKNQQTGEWEDDPMFIDVKVFNRGEFGKQADLAEQSLRKGHQVFLEGHLVLEKWTDKKTNDPRSKHVLVVDNFQFLEPKAEGAGGGGFKKPAAQASRQAPARDQEFDEPDHAAGGATEDIPF
jgi:single-strand DNA-binding protein